MAAQQTTGVLKDVRVLDLSTEYVGALTAMLLADQGAQVIHLHEEDAPAQGFCGRGKAHVLEQEGMLEERILGADVVIEDAPSPGTLRISSKRKTPPGLIHCWIPSFAPEDLRVGTPNIEGLVEAAVGLHESPIGLKPEYTSLALLSTTSAAYAATAIVSALIARERDGLGQRLLIPKADAAYALLELNAMFLISAPKSWATLQWASSPFIGAWKTSDGWIYVHAGLRRHLQRLLDVLETHVYYDTRLLRHALSAQTSQDPTSIPSVLEARKIRKLMSSIFARYNTSQWEAWLTDAGICAAEVMAPSRWRAHPHATSAQLVIQPEQTAAPGAQVMLSQNPPQPRPRTEQEPEAWQPTPTPTDNPQNIPPLSGLRVLDLTQVIAGPTAARTLAELGANVQRIENPHFQAPWVEAFHIAYNAGKTSRALDLKTSEDLASFWAFVDEFQPDVVLQNLRPGAAAALGIDEKAFRERNENVHYVHLTAYGSHGVWGNRPGWEQTAQAASGIQHVYGGGEPDLFPLPFNDLNTGLFGALGVVLAQYGSTQGGSGQRIETDLIRTATIAQAPALFDQKPAAFGKSALGTHMLHRFYKASDGWMFISLPRQQRETFLDAVGLAHTSDEEELNELFAQKPFAFWKEICVEMGGACVQRQTIRQTLQDQRAWDCGLVHRRAHGALGEVTETRSPWRFSRTPLASIGPAPVRDDLRTAQMDVPEWIKRQIVGALSLATKRL